MLIGVRDDRFEEWEELARREPYFALLSDEGTADVAGNAEATEAFFETGEEDVAALLLAIDAVLGRSAVLTRTLDFGCGAGRLTLPLARQAEHVVACDIAPTILGHARQNAEHAGLHNVTFIGRDELDRLPFGTFDFICSLLVFEHMSGGGYEVVRKLTMLLAPGGVAALHIPMRRPSDTLRRLVRLRSLPENRTRGVIRRVLRRVPEARERSEYEERSVLRCVELSGARVAARLPIHRGQTGSVMIIEKA